MANLLPEKQKKENKINFLIRLDVIVNVAVFVVLMFSSVLLVPTYIISKIRSSQTGVQAELLKEIAETNENNNTIKMVSDTNKQILLIEESFTKTSPSKIIESIIDNMPSGIQTVSFLFKNDTDDQTIVIKGIADGRNDLIGFRDSVESISNIENVNLPLSNLAKNKDIEFSLEAHIVLNKK